ncbi:uncharacterized protein PHACADRAFT_132196 [Phanerochaete carnosa HHB-10118-sp]|uniref:Fungal-type protein kinase domain-containing protein n=1 Tax=Phanerochaete carnosa (strain HHB-10118-sp) TaxID=650164 RepID=K5UH16_PHACS|nr:uncharacterized protein PHACADRAFT_132196 [Phanerochaete carnosa HHB-10118-sp]EKM48776.1 hypothetical protein PHACADRAFT_132196 [Phanerochaete carnosa HHB-10118-sp]
MLDDLQETVPQVAWEYFEDCLLPPLPRDVDITAVVDALKKTPAVISRQNKLLWAAFANGTPKSQTDRSEDKVFSAIEKIVVASNKAFKKVSSHSKKLTVRFKCRPTTVPSSESRSNRSKPDGYFLLNEGRALDEVPPKWQNIVVPAEYKKGDDVSDLNANASQILWSLTHAMREDARRRFVFGFTIENTRMRLWFASRQVVLASYPENDFTTAIGRVAGFFLRILYAERHALGFDETIVRLPPGEGESDVPYEIEVGGKWYRTQRLISAIGAESIRGRGTRVWEVKELDGPGGVEIGPCMVLKDGWPDYDRDREEVIHEKILDAAERVVRSRH